MRELSNTNRLRTLDSTPGDRLLVRLSVLQHELCAPVHTILGYAQILLTGLPADDPGIDRLKIIVTKASRLLRALEHVPGGTIPALDRMLEPASLLTLVERAELKDELEILLEQAGALLSEARRRESRALEADIQKVLAAAHGLSRIIDGRTEDETADTGESALTSNFEQVVNVLKQAAHADIEVELGGTVLVVDSDPNTREILTRYLRSKRSRVVAATNGPDAIKAMRALAFDLVLLDVVMPGMNGYEMLHVIKTDPALRDIPVVVLSLFNNTDSVAHCLALGAEDYLIKPFDAALLNARLSASLERKRLRDREKHYLDQIQKEKERSRGLLLNILPAPIATRLEHGQKMIADHFDSVTVLFCDLVGFTRYSTSTSAHDLVLRLNRVFQAFDQLVVKHRVEKIKTMGDAYLAVGGLPARCEDHAHRVARVGLEMLEVVRRLNRPDEDPWEVRIGMHTGPVTAGIIGKFKFAYDLWGDTVNVASRMESNGVPGSIQLSESTAALLKDAFRVEPRGIVNVKGKGEMQTWLLTGEADNGMTPGVEALA